MKTGVTILPPTPIRRKCIVCGKLTDRFETYEERGIEISVPVHEECSEKIGCWYLNDTVKSSLRSVRKALQVSRNSIRLCEDIRELNSKVRNLQKARGESHG